MECCSAIRRVLEVVVFVLICSALQAQQSYSVREWLHVQCCLFLIAVTNPRCIIVVVVFCAVNVALAL